MKTLKSVFIIAVLGTLLLSCNSSQKFTVSILYCEFAVNPVGIETDSPRFSWTMESTQRGQKQTAYQVLVASGAKNLEQNNGDLWDSGKIESSQSMHVEYSGKPLKSHSKYFWQVRVWDKEGIPTTSKTAQFETAFLGEELWQAKWIGKGIGRQPDNEQRYYNSVSQQSFPADTINHDGQSTLLRRAFEIPQKIKKVRIYVCGLGFYELSINGAKVGDAVLAPAKTLYSKQVLYDSYNVTPLLQDGENVLGIQLGNGWYNPYKKWWSWRMQWWGSKRAILQLHLEYADGTTEIITTDENWKAAAGPVTSACIYDGETYDANLEQPGWDEPGFDDSCWENAQVVKAPAGKLVSHAMQPIRVTQTIKPVKLYNPADGVYVYDMGQNFAGWARLKVAGPQGTTVKFRYAENANEDGSLNRRSMNLADASGSYTLKGEGEETYEPRFVYYGFRYVEVTGFPGTPTLDNVDGRVVHSDAEPTGDFECGNELINKIHTATIWSQRSNMVGYPMDCPQRDERLGWMGDAQVTAEEAMLNFYMPLFYANWLNGIKAGQAENGDLPYISPRPFMERGTIAWSVAYPLIVWYHYLYYGDEQIIKDHYETIKRYMEFLDSTAQNYILPPDKYGDWLSIAPGWDRGEPASVSTGYYYYTAKLLSHMAGILGDENEQQHFAEKAVAIADAFNKTYFDPATNQYENGSQFSNTFPLFLGIVPDDRKQAVLDNLIHNIKKNKGHPDTGILGSKYITELLAAEEQNDIAYLLTSQKDYPGWGYLVKDRTTLSEHWNTKTGSNNHVMFGSVDNWYYRTLAGINIDEKNPAFRNIIFKPWVHPKVGWAKASLQTMRGKVASSWYYKNGQYELDISVPVNSIATVYVLAENPEQVIENGKSVTNNENVKFIKKEKRHCIYKVQSGRYKFVSTGIENLVATPNAATPDISPQKTFITMPETVQVEITSDTKGGEIRYTLDGSEPTGNSPVFNSPLTLASTTTVKARAFKQNYVPSFTRSIEYVFVDPEKNGVKYEMVLGEFDSVNDFSKAEINKTETAFQFSLSDLGLPDFDYGLTFTGYIEIEQAGMYQFYSLSNDGSQLFVDNSLVVDNDGGHLAIEESGEVELTSGRHLIVVKYLQTGGGKELKVSYEGPGIEKMEIPAQVLYLEND